MKNTGVENAGLENAGPNFQGGKCTTTVEREMDKYKVERNII